MRRVALALLLALPLAASAWNGAGHRLAAAIAWKEMSPAVREKAAALLAAHPDARRWRGKAGEDPAYAAFVASSTWPDDIRHDRRFFDPEEESPTPALPDFPDMAKHRTWHYVDHDLYGRVRAGELDRQLERLSRILADPRQSARDRAYALPWLVHLVADAHQPLHVGTRDDEGGNQVMVADPFNPRRPTTRLHAWWDDLPGPPWLRGERLARAAAALVAANPPPAQKSPAEWLEESRALSRTTAYPEAGEGRVPVITDDFRVRSRTLANRRVAEAGYRLGRLIEGLLGGVSRGTGGLE